MATIFSSLARSSITKCGTIRSPIALNIVKRFSSSANELEKAKQMLNQLREDPGNDIKLKLYGLYKQVKDTTLYIHIYEKSNMPFPYMLYLFCKRAFRGTKPEESFGYRSLFFLLFLSFIFFSTGPDNCSGNSTLHQ